MIDSVSLRGALSTRVISSGSALSSELLVTRQLRSFCSTKRCCARTRRAAPSRVMNGHVVVVKEVQGQLVILVSGNHIGESGNRKVGIGSYSMNRFIAFREP